MVRVQATLTPVIAAISVGPDDAQTPCFGFGAHLDPHIALSRALTELNQFLPYLESLGRGELAADLEVTQWLRGASLTRDAYLVPSAEPRRSSGSQAPSALRTTTGTRSRPARLAALRRRSPAISS